MRAIGAKAFTLVELMIVIGIVGILATVAIAAFTFYIKNSRSSEAHILVRALVQDEITFYQSPRVDSAGIQLDPCFLFAPPHPFVNPHIFDPPWEGNDAFNVLGFKPSGKTHFVYSTPNGIAGFPPYTEFTMGNNALR